LNKALSFELALLVAVSCLCRLDSNPRLVSAREISWTGFGGPITTNTTWTLAGNPYVISMDIIVIADVFLTIQPGVTIKFENGTSMIIDGTLVAKGNSTSLITFTSNASSPAPSDWKSIRTRTGGSIKNVEWAIIEYSEQGIETLSDSSISRCIFRGNNMGVSGTNASITHCTFENNSIGVNAADSVIADSEFYNNTDGIVGSGNVENCRVYNNSRNGISGTYYSANGINDYVYLGSVTNCSIHNNGGNGTSASSITDCSIYDNGESGVSAYSVTNCSVYNNGERGITANSSVSNCLVFGNGEEGIFSGNLGGLAGSDTNCTVHDNGGNGVSAYSVVNCQVYDNNGTGITAGFVTNCSVSGNGGVGVLATKISGSLVFDNKGIGVYMVHWTGGGAAVSNCDIHDNSAAGIQIDPNLGSRVDPDITNGFVENSRIYDNLLGILITCGTTYPIPTDVIRDVTISDCNISRNLQNGIMTDESSPYNVASITLRVLNTTVDSNGGCGISLNTTNAGQITYFPIYEITDSVITNNTVGAVGTFGNIKGSTIANNSQIGVCIISVDEEITQNNIYGNGVFNVVNNVPFTVKNVNATRNWWGTTNKTLIETSIYDYYEDYNLSIILVEPLLTSPIPEFPTFLLTLSFMITTLLSVTVCRRKSIRRLKTQNQR
jgi:hypothetical protein